MSSGNTQRILNCIFFINPTYCNLFRLLLQSQWWLSTKADIAMKVSVPNFSTIYSLVQTRMKDCIMSMLQKQHSCLVFHTPELWNKIPRAQRGRESFPHLLMSLILSFSLCMCVSRGVHSLLPTRFQAEQEIPKSLVGTERRLHSTHFL